MAYIKHTAIHTTPKAHLKYILNPSKNEDLKYTTAICCTNELNAAYEDFKEIYEAYACHKFDIRHKRKNESVRIHSYIQSFDESVSAETAHEIGVEWAKAMFGEDRPVIISTHTNTGHCHNHIAVCAYDVRGIRWLADRKTYQLARDISDKICLKHGLEIIKTPKKKSNLKYKEWDARKKGYSWKIKMADIIDKLIITPDVTDIDSLIEKMREQGYVFTNEKRLIAKPANVKYGCSFAKLGYGYSAEMLMQRIMNKQNEFAGLKISALLGIQVELAVTLREKQIEIYRSQTYKNSYAEVKRSADLLQFIHRNHIHSLDDMKTLVDKAEVTVNKLNNRCSQIERDEKLFELLNQYGDEYAELLNTSNRSEHQQKRLEILYGKLLHGGIIMRNTHSPDWLSKLKSELKDSILEKKKVFAEMNKAVNECNKMRNYLHKTEDILESDYDRIYRQEHLKKQIEMYHQGYEPQENGTYIRELEPASARNSELEYLEKRRIAELEKLRTAEKNERRSSTYSR